MKDKIQEFIDEYLFFSGREASDKLNELIKEAQREAFEAGSDIDYDIGIGEMQLEYLDFETWYKQQNR